MLGRVGAFLLLAAIAAPYSPMPVAEPVEAGAFDELLRVYEYNGISKQERQLVLTQAEAYDKYYFVMEADEFVTLPSMPLLGEPEDGFSASGTAYVQVKRSGTSDVVCEGPVFEVSSGQKHQICTGLQPETHYVFSYTNTFSAEIQMWGQDDSTPLGN